MGDAAVNLQQGIRRVVLSQALLTLVVAIGILAYAWDFAAASARRRRGPVSAIGRA